MSFPYGNIATVYGYKKVIHFNFLHVSCILHFRVDLCQWERDVLLVHWIYLCTIRTKVVDHRNIKNKTHYNIHQSISSVLQIATERKQSHVIPESGFYVCETSGTCKSMLLHVTTFSSLFPWDNPTITLVVCLAPPVYCWLFSSILFLQYMCHACLLVIRDRIVYEYSNNYSSLVSM